MAADFVAVRVTSNVQSIFSERRFPRSLTVGDVKNKCELLTGVPATLMRIQVQSKDESPLFDLTDDLALLQELNLDDGMILHIIHPSPSHFLSEEENANAVKFEMSDKDYEARPENVRAFKAKLGFGGEEAAERRKKQAEMVLAESIRLAASMLPGQRCEVTIPANPTRRGTVRFVGETEFKPGAPWVGVEYDEPLGKNDGSVNGKQYFKCLPNYGGFVRPQDVTIGDFPVEDFLEDMDEI